MQVVGRYDVRLRLRGGQDDYRDPAQVRIFLDLGQHLAAVFAWEIEVEEDKVRANRLRVAALPAQEGQRLDAVGGDVELVSDLGLFERLDGQPDIAGVVFDEKDVDGLIYLFHAATC